MNIHLTVRFLQLKKEFPNLTKNEIVFEASKKMMMPILYTALTTICAFISLVVLGYDCKAHGEEKLDWFGQPHSAQRK